MASDVFKKAIKDFEESTGITFHKHAIKDVEYRLSHHKNCGGVFSIKVYAKDDDSDEVEDVVLECDICGCRIISEKEIGCDRFDQYDAPKCQYCDGVVFIDTDPSINGEFICHECNKKLTGDEIILGTYGDMHDAKDNEDFDYSRDVARNLVKRAYDKHPARETDSDMTSCMINDRICSLHLDDMKGAYDAFKYLVSDEHTDVDVLRKQLEDVADKHYANDIKRKSPKLYLERVGYNIVRDVLCDAANYNPDRIEDIDVFFKHTLKSYSTKCISLDGKDYEIECCGGEYNLYRLN